MNDLKKTAVELIREFKRDRYVFGLDCLGRLGEIALPLGSRSLVVSNLGKWNRPALDRIMTSLSEHRIKAIGPVPAAAPNAPREDVSRLAEEILKAKPHSIIVADGGSGIDAVKAAGVLAVLGGDVEDYFGTGRVTTKLQSEEKSLLPVLAVQTAASSAAHLTKYSNITDVKIAQKKLIVDEAIVPPLALFDYSLTTSMTHDFTLDGAFDGIAHGLEVFFGAGAEHFAKISKIARVSIELIIGAVERAAADGNDLQARESLGLGTDLGGYAIMVGGTNGGHLTSFSLVDILSHGRACAIMNPYYTIFFGPAIQPQLRMLAEIYRKGGLIADNASSLDGRKLAEAVAEAMIRLARRVGFPTTLGEIGGFGEGHIQRALTAAKNPQLEMKLKNMPVPLGPAMIDDYLEPVLRAAEAGDFSLIKNVQQ
jgi:alcohol dehydrogenase